MGLGKSLIAEVKIADLIKAGHSFLPLSFP